VKILTNFPQAKYSWVGELFYESARTIYATLIHK